MDHHLAGEGGTANARNGYGRKTVVTDTGKLDLQIPRDRQASFDPQLIAKYQRRFPGFDDKVISMYARGMSTREIVGHLRELYGIEVSPDLISVVTDAVLDEITAWQARPLEPVYPLIFFDALRVKIREEALVRNKAVHVALGVRADGTKEILGLWIEQTEGAKFWLRVMTELKNRGVEDVLIAVVDGLKGFPEAIPAVFPEATVQTCIVHLLRHSLEFVAYKDRKAVAAALKDIYRAVDAPAGEAALAAFKEGPWGGKYAAIAQSWRRAWGEVVPFYAFPAEVRRLLYTTNAIEALRVCPGSFCCLREPSEHKANGSQVQEGESLAAEALPVLGHPTAAVQPSYGAFDNPALRQDREALGLIGPLDDLHTGAAAG